MATMSLIAFNEYLASKDDSLFAKMILPESDLLDRDTLIDNILLESADFEVLYSDPYFVQNAIGMWSKKWSRTFSKWVDALNVKYDALNNYDRHEEWEDEVTNNGGVSETRYDKIDSTTNGGATTTTVGTTSSESTDNDTQSSTTTNSGSNSTNTTNKISAFDSSTMQNDTESNVSGSSSDNSIVNSTDVTTTKTDASSNLSDTIVSNSTSGTEQNGTTGQTHNDVTSTKRSGRLYGNIGVTTSQQMLQSELDIDAWNIYNHITDMFIQDFCIPIYY